MEHIGIGEKESLPKGLVTTFILISLSLLLSQAQPAWLLSGPHPPHIVLLFQSAVPNMNTGEGQGREEEEEEEDDGGAVREEELSLPNSPWLSSSATTFSFCSHVL